MTCNYNKEQIIACAYGELDEAEQEEVMRHAGECADCKADLDEIAQTRRVMDCWETVDPGFHLTFVAESLTFRVWLDRLKSVFWTPGTAWAVPAAVTLLFMFLNTRIVYQNGEVAVYFGHAKPESAREAFTDASDLQAMQIETMQMVQQMIQASESRQVEQVAGQLAQFAEYMEMRRQKPMFAGDEMRLSGAWQQTRALLTDLIYAAQLQDSLQ